MSEPSLILFLLNIAGAATLLIWAARLVRIAVERAALFNCANGFVIPPRTGFLPPDWVWVRRFFFKDQRRLLFWSRISLPKADL